ncbi:hypothetical protein QEH59_13335 [Coraliomargarita sp. SDUM461004]|uniref:Uncharacterized protein n=1 Tax=Thalassobacterium sedimentorum TaxID=3041258 RepID=A0ABU1AP79_9BACT|nr:hypothetical protein [Coraliomargarita sp. SDUM461004]MDQ8195413.1 hypothetical protein [Coraliomargarita sp. SDUM461004]
MEEALTLQTQAIEMLKAVGLSPRVNRAQGKLATYFELADYHRASGSAAVDSTKEEAEDLATGVLDLQPHRISFAPIEGQAHEAIFTLSNLSGHSIQPQLQIASTDLAITAVPGEDLHFSLSDTSYRSQTEPAQKIELAPLEQILIRFKMPADLKPAADLRLALSAQFEQAQHSADLLIMPATSAERVHVINAAEIRDNPFYLIPVFHQISRPGNASDTIQIRTRASAPTRIEVYDTSGQLCSVDAEGNGRFDDPGDLLLTEQVDARYPVFRSEGGLQQLEFRYQPWDRTANERIEIDIQTRNSAEADWESDVQDWILLNEG